MRIVTWNCNRALHRKAAALFELEPDVAIVQECERDFESPEGYHFMWMGEYHLMGLGVFTRDASVKLEPKARDSWTYFLPVTMPALDLRLLAVWAFNDRAAKLGSDRDGSLNSVLDEVGPWLSEGRSLIAGDFNNNLRWDRPRGKDNFGPTVQRLRGLGLRSAYHEFTREGFDVETKGTHHFRRNADAKYHIDYCFLHQTLPFSNVQVLDTDLWTKLSDHLPLIVDLR
jgi:endonuclease/exonuclease/phosphatase family metal-dependent hydrolase